MVKSRFRASPRGLNMPLEFTLTHPAIQVLIARDAKLAQWIQAIGTVRLPEQPLNGAHGLAEMIVAQQLSGKVAQVIWKRVTDRFGQPLRWQTIVDTSIDELRQLGLSRGKATYIQGLALKILQEPSFFDQLSSKSDEQVMNELIKLKGIGPWSAHMYLMFVLHRLDVVAGGDLGLKQGLTRLYQLPDVVTETQFRELTLHWAPYRTLASLYLWRAQEARLPIPS